jgi:flagellar biogenesis protein FliO
MNASPELVPSAMTMIAALAAVLGGIFMLVHLGRRFLQRQGGPARERLVRVLASHYIGVKKSVSLVEVPGCVLVLGLSGDRIQLLARIDDPDALARMRAVEAAPAPSFIEQLTRFTTRMKAEGHDE